MLLEIFKVTKQSCLVFRPCQTSDAFLVSNAIRDVRRDVLQCGVLADLLELFSFLHYSIGLGELAKLSDTLVCDGLLWEVSCMLYFC